MEARFPGIATSFLLFGALGCFDVHMIDAGPLVIDDFEDGDVQPADPTFGPWSCFELGSTIDQAPACVVDSGYQSGYSLLLAATTTDPPDGVEQHVGAALATSADEPQDLSRFRELVFNVEIESGNPPLPSDALLNVVLHCSTAQADNGTPQNDLDVIQGASFTNQWQTDTLSLANFGPPFFVPTHITGGPAACLKRVDGIELNIDTRLPDGATGQFFLHVDNIQLR
jgi:hypothetical protein